MYRNILKKIELFIYSNVDFLFVLVLSSPEPKFQIKNFDRVLSVVRPSICQPVSELFTQFSSLKPLGQILPSLVLSIAIGRVPTSV